MLIHPMIPLRGLQNEFSGGILFLITALLIAGMAFAACQAEPASPEAIVQTVMVKSKVQHIKNGAQQNSFLLKFTRASLLSIKKACCFIAKYTTKIRLSTHDEALRSLYDHIK